MELRRAVTISLKWVSVRDRRRLAALLEAYRGAVNHFIRLLWREPGASFSTTTSKRLQRTRLSSRYRDQALKQAIETVSGTRKSAQALGVNPSCPIFRGRAILDGKFAKLVLGPVPRAGYDLTVRLSSLKKGKRLELPSKRTRVLNRWLSMPGAELVAGCGLGDDDLLILWVKFPAPAKRAAGPVLGVDVGVTKLLATSDGAFLGRSFRSVRDKVRRRKPGSRGRRRARRERDQLVCALTKRLPWSRIRAVAFEDLSGIKRGKRRGRGRAFRRAMAPWRPPLVAKRLSCLAQEHGVYDVLVPPRGNSTTCLHCGHRARKNRKGCTFCCVRCGFTADADHVGAIASRNHGVKLLPSRVQEWKNLSAKDQAARDRRRELARRRGLAQGEKKKRARELAAIPTPGGDSSSLKT